MCVLASSTVLLTYCITLTLPRHPSIPPPTPSKSDLYRKKEKWFESLNMSVRVCFGTSRERL